MDYADAVASLEDGIDQIARNAQANGLSYEEFKREALRAIDEWKEDY